MHENPYSSIVDMMRKEGAFHNPPSIAIGVVISPSPNLVITVGDLQVDKDNLYVADSLLAEYKRDISLPASCSVSASLSSVSVGDHGSHTHTLNNLSITGTITFTDTLKKGDLLAVLPTEDRQIFIILSRVVKLT